jgi:hypothetical protein
MKAENRKLNGFEQRELVGDAYWEDARWAEVAKLRDQNRQVEANGLVLKIRSDWGVE